MTTDREALARIAALCDVPWEQGGIPAIWNMQVRAVLAEVTSEPGVTLTPEEVRATRDALDLIGKSRHPRFDALAARLEAS